MPPPSLSMTTKVTGAPRRAEQAVGVVQEAEIARTAPTVGPARPRATPSAVDTKPSIPFAPRFASTRTRSRRHAPLERAHREARRRRRAPRRRATAASPSRAIAASQAMSSASSTASIAARAAALGAAPARSNHGASARRAPARRSAPRAERRRRRRRAQRGVVRRIEPGVVGVDQHLAAHRRATRWRPCS